jgi:hypothetical protein
MSFLVPLFLLGGAAVAVPILVHLTHRERREPVQFPSLMFLRRIPFRTQRRQRIRNWPLFLARALAVLLLALAFARPLLDRAGTSSLNIGAAREVVILLDRSYSMEYGERWTRAMRAADSALGSLAPEDLATLVLFSDRAEATSQPTTEHAELTGALRAARPEPRATRFAPALQLARDLVSASERGRRAVLLITDLQRAGWRGEGDVRLPDGTTFTIHDVGEGDAAANVLVTDVTVDHGDVGSARATATARVTAAGAAVEDVRVTLALDGEQSRERRADVAADAATLVRFDDLPASDRAVRGRVGVAAGDRLARDDDFHFILRPLRPIRALLAEDPGAAEDQTVFLRRVLAIGRRPPFEVTRRRGAIRAADLTDRDVVIVNDAPLRGDLQAVRRFVEAGGGLFVAAGPRSAGSGEAVLTGVLRTPPGAVVDRSPAAGGTLTVTGFDHPVFAPFHAPRSGDFSALRVFRYRGMTPDSGAHVLARFDDGQPALVEAAVGQGRVAVWASDLQNVWNDLPVQPVFLPLMHRLTVHLARYVEPKASYTAGGALDLAAAPEAAALLAAVGDGDLVVEAPSGERAVLADRARIVSLDETGFYTIRPVARGVNASLSVAVNPDLAESNLAALDRAELEAAVAPLSDEPTVAAGVSRVMSTEERERRQGIWWYLLMAVLLLLAVEAAIVYYSEARR